MKKNTNKPKPLSDDDVDKKLTSISAVLDLLEISFRDLESLKLLYAGEAVWLLISEAGEKLYEVREHLRMHPAK